LNGGAVVSAETIETRIHILVSAIDITFENQLITPSLMPAYATIDIMAWLNRAENHRDVRRSDFIDWVELYLLPDSELSCTGMDLYAGRCSLLHSYSAESRLSRQGAASELFYAWGSGDAQELQGLVDNAATCDAKAIRVEKLFAALKGGIQQFLADARDNQTVLERAKKLFAKAPILGG
jgi:hypothetical protein